MPESTLREPVALKTKNAGLERPASGSFSGVSVLVV